MQSEHRERQHIQQLTIWLFLYVAIVMITAYTRDFGTTPFVTHMFGTIAAAFVEPLWKTIFWLCPLFLFLTYIDKVDNVWLFLGLSLRLTRKQVICSLWCLGVGIGYLLLLLFAWRLRYGSLHLQLSFDDWLNSVFLVGLIEEGVFRGFLFQEFQRYFERMLHHGETIPPKEELVKLESEDESEREQEAIDFSAWIPRPATVLASFLSTILFVLVHFPVWILTHVPIALMITTSFINALLGFLMCFVLARTRSLWPCAILHSCYDFVHLLVPM